MLGLGLGTAQGLLAAPAAMAQGNAFAPVAWVNGKVVTAYEVDQRHRFLTMLRQPGDLDHAALQGLIDDRLKLWAAHSLGMKATPEMITAGMDEFASRANLSREQFVKAIGDGGIAPETFRDFIEASITWRELIRAKYGSTVKISDVEVDRAIAGMVSKPEVRVLLSELVIPTQGGDPAEAMALAQRLQGEAQGSAFAAAAREYSASPTGEKGGALDWMPLSNLPAGISSQLMELKPGEITAPLALENAVALLQLRAISDAGSTTSRDQTLEYAQFLIPEGADVPTEVAHIRGEVDSCNDLAAVAKGLPPERFLRDSKPLSQIPQDIALELAKLDPGESSTALRRGGWRVFLMLCARAPEAETPPNRDQIRQQLVGQRLSTLADLYLEELRSEAIIKKP